jgi:hypothetical protein
MVETSPHLNPAVGHTGTRHTVARQRNRWCRPRGVRQGVSLAALVQTVDLPDAQTSAHGSDQEEAGQQENMCAIGCQDGPAFALSG